MSEDEFIKAVDKVFLAMQRQGSGGMTEYSNGMDRVQPLLVMKRFDAYITRYGFNVDMSECSHSYGIGNNHEWMIRDINLVKVGSLHCTNDMYGGVIMFVTVKGEKIRKYHFR